MNSLRTVDGFLACTRGAEAQYEVWTRVVELVSQSPLYPLHPNVDWLRLFTKLGDLLRHDYDWSKEAAAIKALAMTSSRMLMPFRTTHIMELFGLLRGGQRDAGRVEPSAAPRIAGDA
jgi:hypothetical protein